MLPSANRLFRIVLLAVLLLLTTAVSATAQSDDPASIPPPETVTIAGTVQPEMGCPGEWDPSCAESQLTYDAANDIWLATFELPAGDYLYKAALNGTWDDNYGLNAEYYGPDIPLTVEEDGPVTFWYDHKTRWVTDSINSIIATVPGNYQDEAGCSGEWQPDCLLTQLQDPDGDGIYQFVTVIPAGEYEAKVALNRTWDVNYGVDGELDGGNIPFTAPEDEAVIFTYDPETNVMEISTGDPAMAASSASSSAGSLPDPVIPMPDLVVIPGTIQSVLGCGGDWDPTCEVTALTFSEENQLWSASFDIPAGEYEYKAAINGSWDVNFGLNAQPGGPNIPLVVTEDSTVTFYFDSDTGWVTDSVNSLIANVPGSFQSEIGCSDDWMPSCLASWLQDPDGDGTFIFQTVDIPAGEYEAKVAVNLSWDENYGEAGAQDGANIAFSVAEDNQLVTFIFDSGSNLLTIISGEGGIQGNIREPSAYWVNKDTIAWDIPHESGQQYRLHYDPRGGVFSLGIDGISGGEFIPLIHDPSGLNEEVLEKFPHLEGMTSLRLSPDDLSMPRIALKGQVAVSAVDRAGTTINATGLQTPGVIDDLYPYDGELGPTFTDGVPTVRVWAPTARAVNFHLFSNSDDEEAEEILVMRPDPRTGVWSIEGEADWAGKFYLFEVTVFVPSEGSVQTNIVTDPYSVSLTTNSTKSHLIDLSDPAYMPDGWMDVQKPPLAAPEDIIVYELHVRDFSVNDPSVPAEMQGTFKAFTLADSNGMQHLSNLADAGLTHLHLLPTFDIATIDENKANWIGPTFAELAEFGPGSEEQQALIGQIRDQDPFNWGYDPFHYNVPEGSYSTDPNGATRVVEFREMVQSVNEIGLRLVIDVVYNHTNASGQADKSVLDKIVPGYYHRLSPTGRVERSTCCDNTATEHDMMRKLMIDSVVLWATAYKVDGFRFDLMGHHMKEDMLAVRAALDALTLEEHGVDGRSIYVYGEGWNFGEVANNARGVNATQNNMAGTGIGTFNDRLRDAARGGSPFGGQTEQGFVTGLFTDPNDFDQGPEAAQQTRLLQFADLVRIGLAGNLRDYRFVNYQGNEITGLGVDYNGSAAGYTLDPQENIVYVSKHDNETLFDVIQYKVPVGTSTADRARIQTLGNSIVLLSQGIPFFQAGDDLLRSKSLDRNSYNSGDWFNRLDFTYQDNYFGIGLPPAADNQGVWELMAPILTNPDLKPTPADIAYARDTFTEFIQIRQSTPLFRLQTADGVQERLLFHNTGPDQIPGLIVMSISDLVGEDLDAGHDMVVVLFNATPETVAFTETAVSNLPFELHPVQAASVDPLLAEAGFDAASGTFTVPARTTAVFVLPQQETAVQPEAIAEDPAEEATPEAETAVPVDEAEVDEAHSEGEDGHSEPLSLGEGVTDAPGTPWSLWLGALGIGAVAAGLIALFANRRKEDEHGHGDDHH